MTQRHASPELIGRYARGDTDIPDDRVWALEAHLESCASCRGLLAATIGPDVTELLGGVRATLSDAIGDGSPTPARRRWMPRLSTWASPAMLPWLGMTVLVILFALAVGRITPVDGSRLVLLLAPVAPMTGVAAAWARGIDPAYELIAATPRAGLYLLLRRTVVVLAVAIPVLAAGGWLVGASPALWLVPCLAFTVGTLALGTLVGVTRAAIGLGALWAALVVAPSLTASDTPLVLQPISLPGWAVATLAAAVVLVARSACYARLDSYR